MPQSRTSGGGDKRRKPVWMDTRVLSRIKKKRETFERYKQTREGKDYIEYTRARNAAKADTRRAVRDYEREIAKQAKKNPKAFYRYVNGKYKTRAKIANLRTTDGREISGDRRELKSLTSSSVVCTPKRTIKTCQVR